MCLTRNWTEKAFGMASSLNNSSHYDFIINCWDYNVPKSKLFIVDYSNQISSHRIK